MKVELGVFERLWLLNNGLPQKANAATLRVTQELIGVLGLTAEDFKALEIKQTEEGNITWSVEKETKLGPRQIDLSDGQVEVLAQTLKDLDEKKELELRLLPLYDKLVGEG